MAGPSYTRAQTRARICALTLAADHIAAAVTRDEIEAKQYADVVQKLRNEATRLALKREHRDNAQQLLHNAVRTTSNAINMFSATAPATEGNHQWKPYHVPPGN